MLGEKNPPAAATTSHSRDVLLAALFIFAIARWKKNSLMATT